MSNAKKYSRREFLKMFTGGAANSMTQVVAAIVPDPASWVAPRQGIRFANAKARGDAETNANCARCYTPFATQANELLCPACRAQDEQRQSILSNLFPPHTSGGPH